MTIQPLKDFLAHGLGCSPERKTIGPPYSSPVSRTSRVVIMNRTIVQLSLSAIECGLTDINCGKVKEGAGKINDALNCLRKMV